MSLLYAQSCLSEYLGLFANKSCFLSDFFDIVERLNVNNKKLDFKGLATMLINQQKAQRIQSMPSQRPASGKKFFYYLNYYHHNQLFLLL